MKPWKVAIIIGALAVMGLLAAVAIASGADKAISDAGHGGSGRCEGDGTGRMNGPQVSAESQALAEEHSAEMRAWQERYGDDPNSAEAQSALKALRDEHRQDMQGLTRGNGGGRGAASSGCDGVDCDSGDCDGAGHGQGNGQGHGTGQGMLGGGSVW